MSSHDHNLAVERSWNKALRSAPLLIFVAIALVLLPYRPAPSTSRLLVATDGHRTLSFAVPRIPRRRQNRGVPQPIALCQRAEVTRESTEPINRAPTQFVIAPAVSCACSSLRPNLAAAETSAVPLVPLRC